MKYRLLLALLAVCTVFCSSTATNPKREFRGAWIQCVNNQWTGIGRDRMQQTLLYQLDELQKDGINAIMFQVRAEGDALYESRIEPWSRYLTGQQGNTPVPYWDPLEWMVQECHKRGMEIHAWINPFRAKTKGTKLLAGTHPYFRNPKNFFEYDGLILFDPGIPENRNYICQVACDIARRYDIDGLHIDDYFYPYPTPGIAIPDDDSYAKYGNSMDRHDWRRKNVNDFICQLNHDLKAVKPWMKFGVSPFGIFRNAKSDPLGSNTNGLQNYDDLYADVLTWIRNGWVDYNIPQIYWEIGNKAADYDELIHWWSRNAGGRPLFIGQDVERTVKFADPQNPNSHQMIAKYELQRTLPNIQGSCQWYAKAVVDNPGNYGTMLRQVYHNTPALQPLMPWIDRKAPGKVLKPRIVATSDGPALFWTEPKAKKPMDKAVSYAVYRFAKGEKINLENSEKLLKVTRDTHYMLPADAEDCTFVITALDHLHNESKGVKVKL